MSSLFLSNIQPLTLNFKQAIMQDLINRLMAEGLTEQQAYKSIEVIKNFAKEKFPIFGGAIDKLFDKYGPKDEDDFLD
jgi:hypothetical protein